jgi:hypothetical protein
VPPVDDEPEDEQVAEDSSSWFWPITSLVLLIALLLYVSMFDFLELGDGGVGVDSESVRIETVQTSPTEVGTAFVGWDPAGVFTIGFPLRNRGMLVPATVTEIERAPATPEGIDPACVWQRMGISGRREAALPSGTVQPLGSVDVGSGANVQLYVQGGFVEADCPTDPETYSTVESMVVDYKVLGVIPRRQVIPLALKVTTAFDPDDPNLPPAED